MSTKGTKSIVAIKAITRKVIAPIIKDISTCLIHGLNETSNSSDIDIYVVLRDDGSTQDIVQKVAPVLVEAIKETRIFFACFPIYQSFFDSAASQFIKNIKSESIELEVEKST